MSARGVAVLLLLAAPGCRQDMHDQPRLEVYSRSDFFADGSAMRPLPSGVVPRERTESELLRTGLDGEYLATTMPVTLDRDLLRRGRERYEIYCAVCHGYTGKGDGSVVRHGFPEPPDLLDARLRQAPIGHFVDVIANGYGVMYSYASRVEPRDRWAIAAYIRALQRSRSASLRDLTAAQIEELEGAP